MTGHTSLRRRDVAVRVLLVVLLAASAFLITVPERGAAAGNVLFGANPELVDGSRTAGVLELEEHLGREMDLVRDFERWDSQFPAPFHEEMVDSDRLLIISVRAKRKSGTKIQWADINNCNYDFEYTGSNNWVGAPQKISSIQSSDLLLMTPLKKAHDVYATFEVKF